MEGFADSPVLGSSSPTRQLSTVDEQPGSFVGSMGGRLSHALSVASLDSRYTSRTMGRSTRSLSPPPAAGHGDAAASRRRFSSRHVPSMAEELARSQALTPEIITRFNGLMRHLKRNTDWEEQQKQVMVSNMDDLVPEEYEEVLRSEFERRCEFGERTNTEMMVSAKWVRWMKDIGAIVAHGQEKRGGPQRGAGAVDLADADIIFRKVLHDCDYGGRKLTYELFCKALYLLAQAARPDLDGEAAFAELLARIAAAVPEDQVKPEDDVDHMLDPNVMLVLDHYKPALHDLFKTFCKRHLSNPSSGSHGLGTVRIRERTTWKHTQDTISGTASGAGLTGLDVSSSLSPTSRRSRAGSRLDGVSLQGLGSPAMGAEAGELCSAYTAFGQAVAEAEAGNASAEGGHEAKQDKESPERKSMSYVARMIRETSPHGGFQTNSEADAGGGCADGSRRGTAASLPVEHRGSVQSDFHSPTASLPSHSGGGLLSQLGVSGGLVLQPSSPRSAGSPSRSSPSPKSPGVATVMAWAETRGWVCQSASNTMAGTTVSSVATQDPYVYANGAPVIKHRHRFMSADQMISLCKELKIIPDLLTRNEVIKVFKRAQLIGTPSSVGSSIHGFLTKEAFVTAVGHLALDAYAKEPFCDEYPGPHEKVHAFLMSVLPRSAREVRERFLWNCTGRG